MKYKVMYEKKAIKQLQKIDQHQRKLLINWIEKNLQNTENPRSTGKSLQGNFSEYWRYRVGQYRIISYIDDNQIIISIISVGHRKDIYNK